MTPLARLIDAVKAANQWTDPTLVDNARKQGHELTKSNISRYRNESPLISIKGAMIAALAAGLRVSTAQVAVAAVESMGITLPSYELPTVEQAIRLDATLADRDRQILIATVREIREQGIRHEPPSATPVDSPAEEPRASGTEDEKTGAGDKPAPLKPADQADDLAQRRRGRIPTPIELPHAAHDLGADDEGEAERARRLQDQQGEESQEDE